MSDETTLNEYQSLALRTEKEEYGIPALVYHSLALNGEAGEFANDVKKIWRDDDGEITSERRAVLADEIGDVLWYVAVAAHRAGFTLADVAQQNIEKLEDRHGVKAEWEFASLENVDKGSPMISKNWDGGIV